MALFQGRAVSTDADGAYQYFRATVDAILAAAEPPPRHVWDYVLDEAGADDLYSLGHGLAQRGSHYRAVILQVLRDATTSADWNVRDSAARLLGALRDKRARPLLLRLLRDPEPLVRYASIRAITELGSSIPANHLMRLRNDPNDLVRTEAQRAAEAAYGRTAD